MAEKDSTMDGADNSWTEQDEEDDDDGDDDGDDDDNNNGNTMDEIYRNLGPWGQRIFPNVTNTQNHKVLFHLPFKNNEGQSCPPRPYEGHLKWDAHHVRLPSSTKNQYPILMTNGSAAEELVIRSRWSIICDAFDCEILNIHQLEKAIFSYNLKYSKIWKFDGLHRLFDENELPIEVKKSFFSNTLPGIIKLALRLPELLPNAIPLLKTGKNRSVSFTQQQISSLLANAFLCTFPRRNTRKRQAEYHSFSDINFNRLFSSTESSVLEKIKCILNYFRRVCTNVPTGVITISRRCIPQESLPQWSQIINKNFSDIMLHATTNGTIENDGLGLLQVDFANKYLGGGVLGRGCVQEEIRFVICPELFITKLIVEVLDTNEAVFIVGCERFSDYTGYARTFEFDNNYFDKTPKDESNRRLCSIVAIDALQLFKRKEQYNEDLMIRELNKAYCGYQPWLLDCLTNQPPAVASGNWGCGAFGGDIRLKALLQLIVCAYTKRSLVYYTFGDKEFKNEFLNIFNYLQIQKITIAELFKYLKEFKKQKLPSQQLYPFICQFHEDSKSSKPTSNITNTTKVDKFKPPTTTTATTAEHDNLFDNNFISDRALFTESSTSSSINSTWPHERKTKSPTIFNSQSPIKKAAHSVSSGIYIASQQQQQQQQTLLASLNSSYYQNDEQIVSTESVAILNAVSSSSSSSSRKNVVETTKENKRWEMVMVSDDVDMCERGQYVNNDIMEDFTNKLKSQINKTNIDDESEIKLVIPGTPSTPSASTSSSIGGGGGGTEKKTSLHSKQKKISDFLFRK